MGLWRSFEKGSLASKACSVSREGFEIDMMPQSRHGPRPQREVALHDGHCTSSLVQLGASLAVLGLVRGAAGFNCYGNMACLLTYSPEEE